MALVPRSNSLGGLSRAPALVNFLGHTPVDNGQYQPQKDTSSQLLPTYRKAITALRQMLSCGRNPSTVRGLAHLDVYLKALAFNNDFSAWERVFHVLYLRAPSIRTTLEQLPSEDGLAIPHFV
jgi:hypothetical protein